MSINQYSSEAYWWTQPTTASTDIFCGQNTGFGFNLNEDEEDVERERENNSKGEEIPKEALFEKPLTPSDVGKLNRLVIPKQHAEKYFPLNGGDSGDKGFLLGFEDELGKSWRFRYSYWNSSQSYVLTKGWSRFVKEKKLDSGDIVLFQRHRLDCSRLFIGWRRKYASPPPAMVARAGGGGGGDGVGVGVGVGYTDFYSGHPYLTQQQGITLPYQPHCLHAGSAMQNHATSSGNSRKLRLFGVNMECQAEEPEPDQLSTPDGSPMSGQGQVHYPQPPSNYSYMVNQIFH